MEVKLNTKDLAKNLLDVLEIDNINSALKKLRVEFDLNPFNEDDDAYDGVWPEIRHNIELVNDLVQAVVLTLEGATIAGQSLSSPQKLDIAVKALDEALDLPWYAEMFDGPLLKLLVSQAVSLMNTINWAPVGPVVTAQSKAASGIDLANPKGESR